MNTKYKRTKIGTIPIEWDVFRLSEISTELTEKAGDREFETLSISAGIGFVNQANKFGKELSGKQYEKYIVLHRGDFSYNKGNSKKYPQGCIYMLRDREAAAVPNVFESFRLTKGVQEFYEQLFISGFLNQQLFAKINHGVRDDGLLNLRGEDFYKCRLPFPPLPEQQKIAEILTAQDSVISLLQKRIELKQQQKKALMQKLLSGEVRVGNGEWKTVRLGDLCSTYSGGTPSRSNPEYYNGNIKWIKSGELNNPFIYDTEESITQEGLENSSAKIVEPDTLLIAMYGATAGVIAFSKIRAAINQAILALVPKTEINIIFLKNALQNQIQIAVAKLTQGGQPNFNAGIIGSFEINCPPLPEQEKIAEILSAQDREIELLQQQFALEQQKKKALMQLLLTGKVRVKT